MTLALPALAGQRIWVVLSEEGGAYAETAAQIQSELGGDNELSVRRWPALAEQTGTPPDLIVTVGLSAFDNALKHLENQGAAWERVPLLATLLPRQAYEASAKRSEKGRRPLSAVWLDQPVRRQIALLKLALPERRRIGILHGSQTASLAAALQNEAKAQQLAVETVSAAAMEDIYPALKRVMENADILLAVPESGIYNASTLQNILLTTYRSRVPMVAFSAAYVKAGAILALYSTPVQVAQRTVEMIKAWQVNRSLPAPQGPREFSVAINAKVAVSLGLALEDAEKLQKELRRLEGER